MTQKNDGGPAFPRADERYPHVMQPGMSLRDYFATHAKVDVDYSPTLAMALVGSPVPSWRDDAEGFLRWWAEARAKLRYMEADAMLAEREKGS